MEKYTGDPAAAFGLLGLGNSQGGNQRVASIMGATNKQGNKNVILDPEEREYLKTLGEAIATLVESYCKDHVLRDPRSFTPDRAIKLVGSSSLRLDTSEPPSTRSKPTAFDPADYHRSTRISFPKLSLPDFNPLPAGLIRLLPHTVMSSS